MAIANSGQALQQLQQYQSKIQSPSAILSAQEQKLGLPAAQQQVSGLRQAITNTTNLLNQIPKAVAGRTSQSLVTAAQANRQTQNEQAPVAQQLGQQSQSYSSAQSDLDRLMQQSQARASAEAQAQQNRLSTLQDIYQNLFSREQTAQQAKERARAFNLEQQRFKESIRQFNQDLAARRAASSGGGIDLGSLLGGGSIATPKSKPLSAQQVAYNSIRNLFDNPQHSDARKLQEIKAIYQSAGYGNKNDKVKLQIIRQLHPTALQKVIKPTASRQVANIGNLSF